jgi:uncharacterized protein YkwD
MGRVGSVSGMAMALTVALGAGLAVLPARAEDLAAYANEVLDLVNQERQAAGLAPLTRAPELDQSAQRFAQYMGTAHFFDHTGPDGSRLHARIAAAGYRGYTWAENIAAGQRTPQAVVQDWMNSPGHRANILHASLKEIGIGIARVPGSPMGIYWVQDFGARKGAGTAALSRRLHRPDPRSRPSTRTAAEWGSRYDGSLSEDAHPEAVSVRADGRSSARRELVSVAWFGVLERWRLRASERRAATGGGDTVEPVRPPTGTVHAEPGG